MKKEFVAGLLGGLLGAAAVLLAITLIWPGVLDSDNQDASTTFIDAEDKECKLEAIDYEVTSERFEDTGDNTYIFAANVDSERTEPWQFSWSAEFTVTDGDESYSKFENGIETATFWEHLGITRGGPHFWISVPENATLSYDNFEVMSEKNLVCE